MLPLSKLSISTLTIVVVSVLAIFAAITITSVFTINSRMASVKDGWEHFRGNAAEKQIIISDLRNALGYGGLIHNFKNFVLRKDRNLILKVESDVMKVSSLLTAYQNIGQNDLERVAIETLSSRLTKYQEAIAIAEIMARDGKDSREIDAAVRINDELAFSAMVSLVDELAAAYRAESEKIENTVKNVNRLSSRFIAISVALALLSIGFTIWFMYCRVLLPIKSLGHSMTEIAQKNTAHEIVATARNDEIGDMARTVEVFRQVMEERKNFEAALIEARNVADASNKSKTEFLANMSHELRTPLNAIIGFTDMIREETFGPLKNEKYADYLGEIRKAGGHLLDLVQGVLDVSELDAGSVTLADQTVDLGALVDECLADSATDAKRKQIAIINHIGGTGITLRIDPLRIRKVIANVLSNAIKFTPENGTVSIDAFFEEDEAIAISITDTGIGMEPGAVEKALSPFGQIDRGEFAGHEGVGLGLYLSRLLVEMHGGELKLKSIPNGGTRVTIWLPADRVIDGRIPGEST